MKNVERAESTAAKKNVQQIINNEVFNSKTKSMKNFKSVGQSVENVPNVSGGTENLQSETAKKKKVEFFDRGNISVMLVSNKVYLSMSVHDIFSYLFPSFGLGFATGYSSFDFANDLFKGEQKNILINGENEKINVYYMKDVGGVISMDIDNFKRYFLPSIGVEWKDEYHSILSKRNGINFGMRFIDEQQEYPNSDITYTMDRLTKFDRRLFCPCWGFKNKYKMK